MMNEEEYFVGSTAHSRAIPLTPFAVRRPPDVHWVRTLLPTFDRRELVDGSVRRGLVSASSLPMSAKWTMRAAVGLILASWAPIHPCGRDLEAHTGCRRSKRWRLRMPCLRHGGRIESGRGPRDGLRLNMLWRRAACSGTRRVRRLATVRHDVGIP